MSERKAKWGAAKVAFLAHRESIESDMEKGHPLQSIYDGHDLSSEMSYATFCNYANALARDKSSSSEKQDDDGELVPLSIIVHQKFRQLFRYHAAYMDMSEYELIKWLIEKHEDAINEADH